MEHTKIQNRVARGLGQAGLTVDELEKSIAKRLMRRVQDGGLEVEFWDGEHQRCGPDPPAARISLKDRSLVPELMRSPSLTFGEAYAEGRIEVDDLAAFLSTVARNLRPHHQGIPAGVSRLMARLQGRHRLARQRRQIRHHYDLGNSFFELWLDPTRTYSCAYFKTAQDSLEQAQRQKVEHVLRKLRLHPGLSLLDIGCGWGGLVMRAADQGVRSVGVTLSREQASYVRDQIAARELEHIAGVEELDYREASGCYDRIASVGMFEHVGRENYPVFFSRLRDLLRPGGLALLHTITRPLERPVDPWIRKHIFPGGYIPSLREIISALPELDLRVCDVENLRPHYARTLDCWRANFESVKDEVCGRYGEEFFRSWRLFLTGSAVAFHSGELEIHQVLMSRGTSRDLPLSRADLYD